MTSAPGAGDGRLSVAIQSRIDRVCLEFEDELRAGRAPRAEDYLRDSIGREREQLLLELLRLDFDYRREPDAQHLLEELLARFPGEQPVVREALGLPDLEPARAYSAGELLDSYRIECKLGEGSFGVVYRACDDERGMRVALKVPHPRVLRRVESAQRFREEIRTLARLSHPGIVAFHEVIQDDAGDPILVMQYIEGCSLREWQENHTPTVRQSAEIVARIADAMDYAHREGFIHRDLEPRNIILDADERPHVTDFGLALHESHQSGRRGETAGSMAYMSPEQVRGEADWMDGRADIWALGVILYELLTGRRPFRGDTLDELALEIRQRDPKPPRQIVPAIPARIEQICLKCLAKSAAERFTTAGDLARQLRGALGRPRLIRLLPRTAADRRKWLWSSMAAASLVTIGLREWLFSSARSERPPLDATIDVRTWKTGEPGLSNIGVRDPRFAPLRPDDEIRVAIRVNRPAFLYVLVIDAEGKSSIVHPWAASSMRVRSTVQSKAIALSLPADQTWILDDGPRGVATILLLAADTPLPSRIDLRSFLHGLESQAGEPGDEAVYFVGKAPMVQTRAVTRKQPRDAPNSPADALQSARRNCDLVLERLAVFVDAAVAVAMPFQGRKPAESNRE